MLKANIVITKDNLQDLFEIVKFLDKKSIKEISITYPDIAYDYY
jgi:sulfatase maturation enzyme AslB (radical SAM superfamily)